MRCMGVESNAADTAAWELSVDVELAAVNAEGASALSLDIFKCFDQMSREVIMALAECAGAPRGVMLSWYAMMQGLTSLNCLCNMTGEPYTRGHPSPKGAPFLCYG